MIKVDMKVNRMLCILLILSMLFSMFPVHVFAEEIEEIFPEDSISTFLYDENGNLIDNSSIYETANDTEIVCMCGTEDSIHSETCPLYEEPTTSCTCNQEVHTIECPLYETPVNECTCGTEVDVHLSSCPLYEEILDEPVCNCNSIDGTHLETCPLYVEIDEVINQCICESTENGHAIECPMYVGPIIECTCNTNDGVHSDNCPLYVVPTCNCEFIDGVHSETCNLYEDITSNTECICGENVEIHLENCPLYKQIENPNIEVVTWGFDSLMELTSLLELHDAVFEDETVFEKFTVNELDFFKNRINELYELISEPTEIDFHMKNSLLDLVNKKLINICQICGLENSHSIDCEYYICFECGNKEHIPECSQYIPIQNKLICEECNGENDIHLETCSQYKKTLCAECNQENGIHLETCSMYTCDECGEKNNEHLKECSKFVDNRPIYKKLLDCTLQEMYEYLIDSNNEEELNELNTEEIEEVIYQAGLIADDEDLEIEVLMMLYELPNAPDSPFKTLETPYIYFDLSYGNIVFTDTTYSGYDSTGIIEGTHNPANVYYVEQSISGTTSNTIQVGTEETAVTVDFEIHLCGVNIDAPKDDDNHRAAVYVNTNSGYVYLVVDNNTENILKAYGSIFTAGSGSALKAEKNRFGHAAIEKEIGTTGYLVVTCEEGLALFRENYNEGHDCLEDGDCGSIYAQSIGEAGFKGSATRTSAAAAIGSKAEVSAASDALTNLNKAKTMGTLYNLRICGGKITAVGSEGNYNSNIALGGSPGIGVGAGFQQYSIGYATDSFRIYGGYINAIAGDGSAACIGGGYHAGKVNISIYGGTIFANSKLTNSKDIQRGAGIGGGGGGSTSNATAGANVYIRGGTIYAHSEFGAAIGSGAGGSSGTGQVATVEISGGTIYATTTKSTGNGAGAAIGSGGSTGSGKGGKATINISGGTIYASSELGADIGGGGTNSTSTSGVGGEGVITISGGDIVAMTGGIGGGNANAGKGGNATLTINGGTINASSISGGNSKTNNGGSATVIVTDGVLNTGSMGGGITNSSSANIGSAHVEISGGEIHGQIIMDSTNLADGIECSFEMSGGTIDMTPPNNGYDFDFSQNNGAVVYIIGGADSSEAIAKLSGGTIRNGSADNGGAIYIAGGGSMLMSGGTIEDCSAIVDGGAIYIDGGNFVMTGGTITNCEAVDGGAIYVKGGNIDIYNGTIDSNSASNNGGAIYATSDTTDILINVFDGQITNNEAGNHAGAIGASVDGNLKITINIGKEECLGVNTSIHDDSDCPVIKNNIADVFGGAFCLHGNSDGLLVNVYCGDVDGNLALRYPGSNTINQEGGKFAIYGGIIDPGVMVGGGIFEDNRVDAKAIKVRFWGNYEGAPTEPVIIECTLGVTLNFPANTYVNGSHELSGWTNVPNSQEGWVPVGGQYAVYEDEDEYLDYYAVWDAVVSFIVYIPDTLDIGSNGTGEIDIAADLNYFKKDSNLEVVVNSDFMLTNVDDSNDIIYYELRTDEPGINGVLENGEVVASFQYNNTGNKTLTANVLEVVNAGTYEGLLTFVVQYSED